MKASTNNISTWCFSGERILIRPEKVALNFLGFSFIQRLVEYSDLRQPSIARSPFPVSLNLPIVTTF